MHEATMPMAYLPAEHSVQDVAPVPFVSMKEPSIQDKHEVTMPMAYLPAEHSVQDVAPVPVVSMKEPSGQDVHDVCAPLGWYVPSGHVSQPTSMHEEAPESQLYPESHCTNRNGKS